MIEEVNSKSENDDTVESEVLLNEGSGKNSQSLEVNKPEQESYLVQYVEDLSDSANEMINKLGQKIVNEVMQNAMIELEEQLKNEAEIDDNKLTENKALVKEETINEEKHSTTNSEPLVDVIYETDQKPSIATNEHANQSTEVVSNETGLSDNPLTISQSNTENKTEKSQPDLDSTTAVDELTLEESVISENVKEETVVDEPAEENLVTDQSTYSEQLDDNDQQSVDTSSMVEKVDEFEDEPIEIENPQDEVTEDETNGEKSEIELENETVDTEAIVSEKEFTETSNALEPLNTEIDESDSQTVTKASNAKKLGINETSSALAYITLMLNDCAIEKSLQNFRFGF